MEQPKANGSLCCKQRDPHFFIGPISAHYHIFHSFSQFSNCLLNAPSSPPQNTLTLPFPCTVLFSACLLCEFLPISPRLTFPLLFSVCWKWTFEKPVITSGLGNNTAQTHTQTAGRRERRKYRSTRDNSSETEDEAGTSTYSTRLFT